MKKKFNKSEGGFTIIEVVLVLAIAGLIFMVVFLALPGLQRGQRDTQRRQDLARFKAQLIQYQGDNKGRLPGYDQATAVGIEGKLKDPFIKNYMDVFIDPQTQQPYSDYLKVITSGEATPSETDRLLYVPNGVCIEGGGIQYRSGSNFAIAIYLESGGGYCEGEEIL